MPKGVYKKPGDISIAKRVTQEQRVLQSSFSNQVEVQISKRPRLMKDQTQQHAVPYENPCAADNERGAAEHDDREVAGQGEEDEGEEEVEDEDQEEDEDKDEDENVDKKRVLQSTYENMQNLHEILNEKAARKRKRKRC